MVLFYTVSGLQILAVIHLKIQLAEVILNHGVSLDETDRGFNYQLHQQMNDKRIAELLI